jgi:hypothetical protein
MKIDELITKYIELRDKKADLKKQLDEKVLKIDEAMKIISLHMKGFLDKTGQKNATTEAGTVYKESKVSVKVSDPAIFFDYVKNNDAFDLLPKSVCKAVYMQYKEEGGKVPGITETTFVSVGVRRR